MAGEDVNTCCHSNLVRAAVGDGLEESDVQDVLSVVMCTGHTRDTNQYFHKAQSGGGWRLHRILGGDRPDGQRLDVPPGRRDRCLRRPGRLPVCYPLDRGNTQTQGGVARGAGVVELGGERVRRRPLPVVVDADTDAMPPP